MTREEDLIRIAKKLDKMVRQYDSQTSTGGLNLNFADHPGEIIGMSVNGIRKHCTDEEVIALAKVLIKDWKRLLGTHTDLHAYYSVSTAVKWLLVQSIHQKSKSEAPKTPTTPTSPMSPSFSSPGGPLSPHLATGDSIRDKCIEMLAAALRTDNDYREFGANCEGMAAEIEDHILQTTDMKYKNRVRSRISNLKDPKNPGLRKNVLAGSIELRRIATMSAEEMASDELKQLRNVLTQEAIREHQMAKTGGTTTDLLQCGKCKKKNCTYNQVHTCVRAKQITGLIGL
uniref:Transcription elongation factor A (SII), 3 n=1 Tax=Maylandia zebra TaxID=106582 RepID=A0A3P9CVK2_9CICH